MDSLEIKKHVSA